MTPFADVIKENMFNAYLRYVNELGMDKRTAFLMIADLIFEHGYNQSLKDIIKQEQSK